MAKRFFLVSVLLFFLVITGRGQTVTDIEGNTYNTVKIGDQVWIAENLKTTKFNDGTSIPLVKDMDSWRTLVTPGYCWFKNSQENFGNIFGPLYNWYAVNTGRLCLTGWHVPSNTEWVTLTSNLGGDYNAGGKLKEAGTAHWKNPNIGGFNETGFTALPGGRRNAGGIFSDGGYGYWWSATESKTNYAFYRGLGFSERSVDSFSYNEKCGFSVRCIMD
jgi:uncharacterized protein (TIGR02145 family)